MAYRRSVHGLESVVCYRESDFDPNVAETERAKIAYFRGQIVDISEKLIKIRESATIVVLLMGTQNSALKISGLGQVFP